MSNPTKRLTTNNAPQNSFVIPGKRIVYISVTKAACTSMRWMVADLAGEDRETFSRGLGATQNQLMTIHGGRNRWKHTPQLRDLDEATLRDIHPDNGWFVFAVVRNPWSRLWSAWQSKFLVQHAFYQRTYADEPYFPKQPERPEDVLEDFDAFVAARPWEHHPTLADDAHFRTQSSALAMNRVPYSRVYDLREMKHLFDDLHAHLRSLGMDQELYVPRGNETPLAPVRQIFEGKAGRVIEDAYAVDFGTFPDWWSTDDLTYVDTWSDDALANVRAQVAANERISALAQQGQKFRAALKDTQEELADANRRIAELEKALAAAHARPRSRSGSSLANKVVRRLGRRVRKMPNLRHRSPSGTGVQRRGYS